MGRELTFTAGALLALGRGLGGDSHPEGRGRETKAQRYELGTLARQDSNPPLAPGPASLPPALSGPSPSVLFLPSTSPPSSPPPLLLPIAPPPPGWLGLPAGPLIKCRAGEGRTARLNPFDAGPWSAAIAREGGRVSAAKLPSAQNFRPQDKPI